MRERMRLEKAQKNDKQPEADATKKRKHPGENNTEVQQKSKKSQKQKDNKETEQKTKETEANKKKIDDEKAKEKELKKKKEEEKRRQELLLQTRKSQAAVRWASSTSSLPSSSHQTEGEVTIVAEINSIPAAPPAARFTAVPLRGRIATTSACDSSISEQEESLHDVSLSPISESALTQRPSSLLKAKQRRSTSESNNSPRLSTASTPPPEETPRRPSKNGKTDSDPRRGLHFQSSPVESSSEDEDEETSDDHAQDNPPEVAHANCCREKRLENEALRKRITKLHKRLNIARKSITYNNKFCLCGKNKKNKISL